MRNDGRATFDLVCAAQMSEPPAARTPNSILEYTRWGDLDQDGDLDLLVDWTISGPAPGDVLQFLRNDGAAGYTDASAQIQGQANGALLEDTTGSPSFELNDIDADGDLDIAPSLVDADFFPAGHALVLR